MNRSSYKITEPKKEEFRYDDLYSTLIFEGKLGRKRISFDHTSSIGPSFSEKTIKKLCNR